MATKIKRYGFLTFLTFSFVSLFLLKDNCYAGNHVITPLPDSIQPPPPAPAPVSGPSYGCIGDTAIFDTDISVGCTPLWYYNDSLIASGDLPLQLVWWEPGVINISLFRSCNGQTVFMDSVSVIITAVPEVFLGNDTILNEGDSLILDAQNPGAHYQWSTGDTTRFLTVREAGEYSVTVSNSCGSDADTIVVDIETGISQKHGTDFSVVFRRGNYLFINTQKEAAYLKIIDLSGRVLYKGRFKDRIYLPKNQFYIIEVLFRDGKIKRGLFFK